MEHDLVPEEWGGSTIIAPLSAKTGEGIDSLLEMIQLVSDVQELKTAYEGQSTAITIESTLDKQRGAKASILIQSGILNVGDHIVIGPVYGKVKSMVNDLGETVKTALPSTPVELYGLSKVPKPGDILKSFKTEQEAKKVAEERQLNEKKDASNVMKSVSLNTLSQQISDGDVKKLNLIIKADVNDRYINFIN